METEELLRWFESQSGAQLYSRADGTVTLRLLRDAGNGWGLRYHVGAQVSGKDTLDALHQGYNKFGWGAA